MTETSRGAIGAYLARQRRLRGISLDDLSDLTKIPRRSLERLEAGAFDSNPDGFARGFVRTVAGALGLEPEDAVMRLLAEPDAADEEAEAGRVRLLRSLLIGTLIALAAGALIAAAWWLRGAASAPVARSDQPPVVYRRDAVRALADAQPAATESAVSEPTAAAAVETEPVDSAGDDPPHGSADPSSGRDR